LVALVGNKANANLGDSDWKRIVHNAGAVASLDSSVEEKATMNALNLLDLCLVDATIPGRAVPQAEPGEYLISNRLSDSVFLVDCLRDFLFESAVERRQVFPRLPGVQIQRTSERLTERKLELPRFDWGRGVRAQWRDGLLA
jgi:hypothetical protein